MNSKPKMLTFPKPQWKKKKNSFCSC